MSGRQLRAVSLSLILSFFVIAIPLSAAPPDRDGGGRSLNPIERVIKRIVKYFGVSILSDTMSVPIPK